MKRDYAQALKHLRLSVEGAAGANWPGSGDAYFYLGGWGRRGGEGGPGGGSRELIWGLREVVPSECGRRKFGILLFCRCARVVKG